MRHGTTALILLGLLAFAKPAAAHLGPSFDCAKAKTPFPELICSNPALSRLDLKFSQAYFALRQQTSKPDRSALLKQAIAFHQHVEQACDVPAKGSLPADTTGMIACVTKQYEAQRQRWIDRMNGPARQEATMPLQEHIYLQRDLRRLGFLPPTAHIDGVYGRDTRSAIKSWQKFSHKRATGLMTRTDASALMSGPYIHVSPDAWEMWAWPPNWSAQKINSIPNPKIIDDRKAENLLVEAEEGSETALHLLKIKSASKPAYGWALSHYDSEMATTLAGGIRPPSYFFMKEFNKDLEADEGPARYSEYKKLHSRIKRDAAWSSSYKYIRQVDMEKHFVSESRKLLIASTKSGDPAMQAALASSYLSSALNYFRLMYDAGNYNSTDIRQPFGEALLKASSTMCRKAFNLAMESWRAGWPGAFSTLIVLSAPGKKQSMPDHIGSLFTLNGLLKKSGCMGEKIPGYPTGNAIIRAAAQRGSIWAIGSLWKQAARDGNRSEIHALTNELKGLAAQGDLRARKLSYILYYQTEKSADITKVIHRNDVIPKAITCGDYLRIIKSSGSQSVNLFTSVKRQMVAAVGLVEQLNLPTGPNSQKSIENMALGVLPETCRLWPYKSLAFEVVRMYIAADAISNAGPGYILSPNDGAVIDEWLSH